VLEKGVEEAMQEQSQSLAGDDGLEILQVAFKIYGSPETPNRKECLRLMASQLPGLSEREYASAWNRVNLLYEQACKLAFRWANENPPGAEIDEEVVEQVFLDEIARKCQGFTRAQYRGALMHGFDRGIF
jgi:hypothetical protein